MAHGEAGHSERSKTSAPLRLFIGIPLAGDTAAELTAVVNQVRSEKNPGAASLRWSTAESWHITLQFLGSTTPRQYECVTAQLRELHPPSVPIELGTLGIFDRAGVLFVDVYRTPQLLVLQQAVTSATAPCGFIPEGRPYHPHITLARRKGKGGSRELQTLKSHIDRPPNLPGFNANAFLLYESVPTPEGSRYEIRERFPRIAAQPTT